ncbi:phage major capsid protein [uncultured Faecalibaculum sp.]|uniref:phage major capsid protein n=1 Tax=uncultured Faecalibaculum sp. TaxID=1729681 RepID=UPI0025E21EDB|nr:phage major capsid protein [uncultured Faecalibaculum sp.]
MENIKTATAEQVIARLAEIQTEMEKDDADLDALNTETDELLARKAELKTAAEEKELKRKNLMSRLNEGIVVPEKTITSKQEDDDMVERKAFMDYVISGKASEAGVLKRADAVGVSTNLGVMIPKTVQQKIIQEVKKIHGRLYGKVKHLNLQGAVEYPIGSFTATFKRITETTVSDRQNPGGITGSIMFKYNIGEIRLSRTLLQTVLTVPAFETELAKVIAEAYVKAMDGEIVTGVPANGQLEGILTKTGIKTIEINEDEMKDWKTFQKKIMAKIPLGMKNKPYEYIMSNGTFEGNIMTLADDNNRPVYTETINPVDGWVDARIKGHGVTLVEPELLPDFDTATAGKVFAVLWVPGEAYAINSNMQFSTVRYMDHDKNEEVTKALVINDGKVLRPDLIYQIKKVAKPAVGS